MSNELSDTIPLIHSGSSVVNNSGRATDKLKRGGENAITERVSIENLRQQIAKLSRVVEDLNTTTQAKTGLHLEEVKIVAEVTASGELGFLVAGASLEAKGSIELTFKRQL